VGDRLHRRLGLESIRVLEKIRNLHLLLVEASAFRSSCLNFIGVMSPFSRMIGDVGGVVALPCVMHSAGGCATCTAMVCKCCSGTQAFCNVSTAYCHYCKGVWYVMHSATACAILG